MFEQDFYQTHRSEAFALSNCLRHETSLVAFIESLLISRGYQQIEQRQWQKNNQKVVVCFVDDFRICSKKFTSAPAQWFDSDTVVITDNWLPFATQYTVCKTPDSYFGIYNYVPRDVDFCPTRRFHVSMNRLDSQRLLLFFEFQRTVLDFSKDYVNFNARPGDRAMLLSDVQQHFDAVWNNLQPAFESDYHETYLQTRSLIPVRNHDLEIEQACVRAYLNIVVETYAGDQTVAFSEKIFRALVTPAPWIVYSARGAVKYLKDLGFDVMDDLVDHSYDTVSQDNSYMGINKIRNFVVHSQAVADHLMIQPMQSLKERCNRAAYHNQQLLSKMSQKWHLDCAAWLPNVIAKVQ
jgi:hypothetical protein